MILPTVFYSFNTTVNVYMTFKTALIQLILICKIVLSFFSNNFLIFNPSAPKMTEVKPPLKPLIISCFRYWLKNGNIILLIVLCYNFTILHL